MVVKLPSSGRKIGLNLFKKTLRSASDSLVQPTLDETIINRIVMMGLK